MFKLILLLFLSSVWQLTFGFHRVICRFVIFVYGSFVFKLLKFTWDVSAVTQTPMHVLRVGGSFTRARIFVQTT